MPTLIKFILVLCALSLTGVLHAHDPVLRGEAFFDNRDKIVDMPPEWVAQTVTHEAAHQDADLVVTLNQDTYPILAPEIQRYAAERGLKIVMQSGTCGTSAGKLMQTRINSGAFCCPPGDMDRLPGLEFHTLAITAVAVVVNAQNPLEEVTLDEARDIFRGRTRHWQELGTTPGLNEPIATTARLHCTKRPGHWTLLLANETLFSPTLREVGVIPDLVARTAQERNAVALETPYMVREHSAPGQVKLLRIDGHAPTDIAHLASGGYPVYRTFNMTTWSNDPDRDRTLELIAHLRDYIEAHHERFHMAPVSLLREAGWQFIGDELVGEPSGAVLVQHHPEHHDHHHGQE